MDANPDENKNNLITIVVGNPGVGKSTVLNSLADAAIFKSGLSWGSGMTQVLQFYKVPGSTTYYGDTPGLSDIEMRKKAALEIEAALKKNGKYRLVFVLTLESGRARPEDATTIKLVLEAVNKEIPFGILINKLELNAHARLQSDMTAQQKVVTGILSGVKSRSTPHFHPIPYDMSIASVDDCKLDPERVELLRRFMAKIPHLEVNETDVHAINTETYDDVLERSAKEIKLLREDSAAREKKFQELLKQSQDEAKRREAEAQAQFSRQIQAVTAQLNQTKAENKSQRAELAEKIKQLEIERNKPPVIHEVFRDGGGGGGGCTIL